MYISTEYNKIMQERYEAQTQDVMTLADCLSAGDIHAGFPAEDCLQGIIDKLSAILRAPTQWKKAEILWAIDEALKDLDDKQIELSRAAEYGREELAGLERQIDEIKSLL